MSPSLHPSRSDPARLFIALYIDEDITSELAPALRERGFEAQSAAEAGLLRADDAQQLAYAAAHDLTLLTCNASHFLLLARQYAAAGRSHPGVIISAGVHAIVVRRLAVRAPTPE